MNKTKLFHEILKFNILFHGILKFNIEDHYTNIELNNQAHSLVSLGGVCTLFQEGIIVFLCVSNFPKAGIRVRS